MHLGYDINQVCATNLIYERSSRETDLTLEQFDCYKPLLLRTFDLVMPTVVIAFGKKPLLVLQEQFSRLLSRHDFPSGHGTWKISIIKGVIRGRNVTVIGLPHLSRYSLVNRIDQLRLIKDACT